VVDWATAKADLVEEALRDSETYLSGTVSLAASADQRAAVVGGTFATAAAAIAAGVIGFSAAAGSENIYRTSIYAGGISAAALFIIGAEFCIRASMPVGFHLPGTRPRDLAEDVAKGRTLIECQQDLMDIRETAIKENLAVIERNARSYKIGAWFWSAP
jgi:hypothetical protein